MTLAKNSIHQGDCLKLLDRLDPYSIDLVFADGLGHLRSRDGSLVSHRLQRRHRHVMAVDLEKLAQLISEVIKKQTVVKDEVAAFRKHFLEMKFCFSDNEFYDLVEKLHRLI